MLQKLELQQLQALSLEDVKSYKKKAIERKAELEAATDCIPLQKNHISRTWNFAINDKGYKA